MFFIFIFKKQTNEKNIQIHLSKQKKWNFTAISLVLKRKLKNSIRDAHIPQPTEIFLTP